MKNNRGSRFPMLHVPHDGRRFPPELAESVCVPEKLGVIRDIIRQMIMDCTVPD